MPVLAVSSTHSIGILPLLDALVAFVTPPSERRVAIEAERGGEVEYLEPPQTDTNPVVAYVFHSHTDKYGTLTYFRLFNGSIKGNDTLYNLNMEQEERLGNLMTMRGETQIPVEALHAGDIGVVAKLRDTRTGHTLASKDFKKFVKRPFFSMPVYAVALHPRTQSDSTKMGEILTGLSNADPTLHWYQDATLKQTILEGIGRHAYRRGDQARRADGRRAGYQRPEGALPGNRHPDGLGRLPPQETDRRRGPVW